MKYFSLNTVAQSYNSLKGCTKNKFWGFLGILSTLDSEIIPGQSYSFNSSSLSSFLENLFRLDEDKKFYNSGNYWNVKFSRKWVNEVSEQMLPKTPNLFDLIVWCFRREPLPDSVDNNFLLNLFFFKFHLRKEEIEVLFNLNTREYYTFSDSLYQEGELYQELVLSISDLQHSKNITFEGTFVSAHPGELSRAPFIQTLYAAQSTLECLLLTQFDLDDYYLINKKVKQVVSSNREKISCDSFL